MEPTKLVASCCVGKGYVALQEEQASARMVSLHVVPLDSPTAHHLPALLRHQMSFSEVMCVLEALQHAHGDKNGVAIDRFRTGASCRGRMTDSLFSLQLHLA